jgi:hypothetical protein
VATGFPKKIMLKQKRTAIAGQGEEEFWEEA